MPGVAWWLLALPFIAGTLIPLQTGINGQLARSLSSALTAAFISFFVGTIALLCVVLIQRDIPALGTLRNLSWWHYSGGLLGAIYITVAAFAAPRTGAILFMALILAGQLAMALMLDHFGWAGFRENPVSASKIAGLLLIVGGIWLIQRG